MTALRTRLYETLAASRADVVAGLRRGDVLARVGADVDAVGDLVVRAWLPAAVAAGTGALTALAVGLIHPPAGLVLGACLLLAGIAGPLVTMRSARAAERARTERAADLSAALLTALEGGAELSAAGRMPAVMEDLEDLERGLAATRDRAARPAAAAAAVDAAAAGLAVLGGVLTGLPAVASGALDGVWLAVIVLVLLFAFEAIAALGPAAVAVDRKSVV